MAEENVLRLAPIFKETVWGGTALRRFGYANAGDRTGECWGISAHKNGDCLVVGGAFDGKPLSYVYEQHRELFGNIKDPVFPLLVKIIGAAEDLSIQVHPDDAYAAEHEQGSLGKTECWYILDCEEDATIVVGHHAQNKQELKDMITEGRWKDLIREIPIRPGDFFQIEPGCLHAIKGGTLLIETQQASDITYRVYDYDRLSDGKPRPLHLQESIDCIKAPFVEHQESPQTECIGSTRITTFVRCAHYTMQQYEVKESYGFSNDKPFLNVSVIEGAGTVNGETVTKGDHLILTSKAPVCELTGEMKVVISYLTEVGTIDNPI